MACGRFHVFPFSNVNIQAGANAVLYWLNLYYSESKIVFVCLDFEDRRSNIMGRHGVEGIN